MMTDLTTNFSLPYPSSTDEPCDFAEQWCDFTAAVDTVLEGFQQTLDRTYPVIPIASMKLSASVLVTSSAIIPFDTVAIDTAAWTDADIDNTLISPDMAAVLTMSSTVEFAPAGGADLFTLLPLDTLGTITSPALFLGTELDTAVITVGVPVEQPVLFSTGIWQKGISGFSNRVILSPGGGNLTISHANFCFYWHSDGGTV
jgi:hypothetical protein